MPTVLKVICFTAAFFCFLLNAWKDHGLRRDWPLLSIGLALFVLPFAWDAWEALD